MDSSDFLIINIVTAVGDKNIHCLTVCHTVAIPASKTIPIWRLDKTAVLEKEPRKKALVIMGKFV